MQGACLTLPVRGLMRPRAPALPCLPAQGKERRGGGGGGGGETREWGNEHEQWARYAG